MVSGMKEVLCSAGALLGQANNSISIIKSYIDW